jgi:pyruvate/2-oxoglutarate dehydrogenase complex dihydrolipoamide acyltransferase (E2) component
MTANWPVAGCDRLEKRMTPVLVPQLGNEISEAEVTEWLVAVGDTVAVGEPIVTISTTKMAIEIEATVAGRIASIAAEVGEIVLVNATLAQIE